MGENLLSPFTDGTSLLNRALEVGQSKYVCEVHVCKVHLIAP